MSSAPLEHAALVCLLCWDFTHGHKCHLFAVVVVVEIVVIVKLEYPSQCKLLQDWDNTTRFKLDMLNGVPLNGT